MADLIYPTAMTDDLREVLGMMNFVTCPMAHAFRDAGRAEIRNKCEEEQAFILDWLIRLVLEHGTGWRRIAGETLQEVIAEAKAARAARGRAGGHGG
ncbi:hypothetical protein [uncultured Methylobacterium sp.]|uniref:hypothetical protein n=1 Tax=uncultured Methylobacterium sp. TaxID=157278 RepID=UPI0035CC2341